MRNLFALCIPLVVACGGGGKDPPVVINPDAPVTPDAPPAVVCAACSPDSPCTVNGAQQTSLGGLILIKDPGPDGMVGTADDTALGPNACGASGTDPCDFFDVPTMGANNGRKTFVLIAGTPAELNTGEAGSELLLGVELVSNNGVFIAGETQNSTNPAAITSAAIFAMPMGTTQYDALTYIVSVSGQTINTIYISTSGSIKTTEIPTNGDGANGKITGEVTTTNFSETDGMTTGGCQTSLDGLTFKLIQGTATFQKPALANMPATPAINKVGGKLGVVTPINETRARAIYANMQHYLRGEPQTP